MALRKIPVSIAFPSVPASYALVDAPNAAITFSGGSNWYGSVIGKTVNDSGGTAVHFDRSLLVTITNGKFQIVGFNWSKF